MPTPLHSATMAALVLAVVPSCTSTTVYSTTRTTRSAYGLLDHTGETIVELDSPAGVDVLRVDLEVDCSQGCVSIRLLAPDGTTPWQQAVVGGHFEQQLRLSPRAGQWKCAFGFEDFSGHYGLELVARDEPPFELQFGVTAIEVVDPEATSQRTRREP